MDNTLCLTSTEMSVVNTVFIECFESELIKQSLGPKTKIEAFLFEHASSTKLHTLFTANGLKTITETVFNDIDIRDFVLCLSDQFNCIIAINDFEERSIEYSIGYGLNHQDFESNKYILIPERVYNNMEINGDLIYSILQANRWLLTLVLIYLFFQKTFLFQLITQSNSLPNK